jgi:hypothetical protein
MDLNKHLSVLGGAVLLKRSCVCAPTVVQGLGRYDTYETCSLTFSSFPRKREESSLETEPYELQKDRLHVFIHASNSSVLGMQVRDP